MSALAWHQIAELDGEEARFEGRKVGYTHRLNSGDFAAACNAPDFRYRQLFQSNDDAKEWIEREWADFVRLLFNKTPTPVGNGGW